MYLLYIKNIKKSYKNNKFQISTPTLNVEFKLPYSISDTQDYLKYIFKKHRQKTVIPSIKIYINKIENRISFKIKTGYYLELLTPSTIKLLGRTKSRITQHKNGEDVPYLEITEVVLIHCNVI